jgi:hypothetical protein
MKTSPVCPLCGEKNISQFRARVIKGKEFFIKHCRVCETKLSRAYYASHKEERAVYQKKYRSKNQDIVREKKKEYDKERYPSIREDRLEYQKEYAKNNRNIINNRKKRRIKLEPAFRLRNYVSARIRKILGKSGHKKKGSCIKHLEYSFMQLKEHIQNQFEPWMTWDNQSKYDPKIWDDNNQATWSWQLDHIIPASTFQYSSMEDDGFKKCWALSNLRPLSAKQNHLDGVRRVRHGK